MTVEEMKDLDWDAVTVNLAGEVTDGNGYELDLSEMDKLADELYETVKKNVDRLKKMVAVAGGLNG